MVGYKPYKRRGDPWLLTKKIELSMATHRSESEDAKKKRKARLQARGRSKENTHDEINKADM